MDPLRLATTLSLVLALAGIGGAFRACDANAPDDDERPTPRSSKRR